MASETAPLPPSCHRGARLRGTYPPLLFTRCRAAVSERGAARARAARGVVCYRALQSVLPARHIASFRHVMPPGSMPFMLFAYASPFAAVNAQSDIRVMLRARIAHINGTSLKDFNGR